MVNSPMGVLDSPQNYHFHDFLGVFYKMLFIHTFFGKLSSFFFFGVFNGNFDESLNICNEAVN